MAFDRRGANAWAATHFQHARRLQPDNAEFRMQLGCALNSLRDLPEAIIEMREAVRLKPQTARYHAVLGLTLTEDRQFAEGRHESLYALWLCPWHPAFWAGYGIGLIYAFVFWLFRLPKDF